jgi:hypothetical protein
MEITGGRGYRDLVPARSRLCGRGILLLLVCMLSGCMKAGSDASHSTLPLYPGAWRGDVAPAGGAPFGALFHVSESEAGLTLRLESQFISPSFSDILVAPDLLQFTWPHEAPRRCRLGRRADGGWSGACQGDGTDPIDLLLVPPDRRDIPTGLARAALESDIPWIVEREDRLRILIQDGGTAATHVAALRERAVAAFDHAFTLLEAAPPEAPFWIIYIDSRDEMRELVEWPVGGTADGVAHTSANVVTADGLAPDRHEMMHVAATVAWGIPAARWEWIHEGLATYAAGECGGADIHNLASALVENGAAVPLRSLINDFREIDEVTAYLQAASIIGYIRERFGIAAVRSIWRGSSAVLPDVTGMDFNAFESTWREFVSHFPPASDALEAVHNGGCI